MGQLWTGSVSRQISWRSLAWDRKTKKNCLNDVINWRVSFNTWRSKVFEPKVWFGKEVRLSYCSIH